MDSLPVEIVLKILQKSDDLTLLRLKYINHRIFSIMKKFKNIYEVNEIRLDTRRKTILFYDGSEYNIATFADFNPNRQNKIIAARNVSINGLHYFTSVHNRDKASQDYVTEQFPKLESIDHLEVKGDYPDKELALMLKRYQVKSLKIIANNWVKFKNDTWRVLLQQDISLVQLSVTWVNHFPLNDHFVKYVKTKNVNSVQLSGDFYPSEFDLVLGLIKETIKSNRSIKWIIDITNYDLCLETSKLGKFLIENRKTFWYETEYLVNRGSGTVQKLTILFSEGHVTFYYRGNSYLKWKKEYEIKEIEEIAKQNLRKNLAITGFICLIGILLFLFAITLLS